jgi:hypothetical protein
MVKFTTEDLAFLESLVTLISNDKELCNTFKVVYSACESYKINDSEVLRRIRSLKRKLEFHKIKSLAE